MKIKIKKINLIAYLFFLALASCFFMGKVKADQWNGAGSTTVSCKGQSGCYCNQGDSELCLWDQGNHVILKVSLYYFPSKTGLSGGSQIGYKIYGSGNYSLYQDDIFKNGEDKIYALPSTFEDSTKQNFSDDAKAYFYDNKKNFYTLFNRITGKSVGTDEELQDWMLNYCVTKGYADTLNDCHDPIGSGSKRGFRIVIQPIITGLYGKNNAIKIGTVKTIFGSYTIWNSSTTKKAASVYMYLPGDDLGFYSVGSGGTTNGDEVSKSTSGYGLNMFTWPVPSSDVCDPDKSGVKACCDRYKIKLETDANNKDKTKIKRPMTQAQLDAAKCRITIACDPSKDGVKTCCDRYDIKYSTDLANHDSTKIKVPMTQAQLDAAGCRGSIACSYTIDKTIPTACQTNRSGAVSDKATWSCLFTSTMPDRDTSVKNKYLVSSFSNKYCAIYCKEDINYEMPGAGAYADTGTYFVIDSTSGRQQIGPISYSGKITCRSTSQRNNENGQINIAQFTADFNAANSAVVAAYDNWQYAELQNEVINSATSKSWSTKCTDTYKENGKNKTCSKNNSGTYYTYTNKNYSGATFSKSTGISDGGCGCSSKCGSSCTAKEALKNTASLKSAYEAAVANRNSILEELNKCNNFYSTYKEFQPEVSFTYDDPVYGGVYKLKSTGTVSSTTRYFNSGSGKDESGPAGIDYSNIVKDNPSSESSGFNTNPTTVRGYTSTIKYNDCGYSVTKKGCTKLSNYTYPANTWFEQSTLRTYKYTLPDGLNNYIDKPSGFSSSTPTTNYEYIPFSNLPIHYSTPVGNHTYYVTTSSYGNGNQFNQYLIGSAKFNGVSYSSNNKYSCTYRLDYGITCEQNECVPKVIARPISLYYPFPGQNATQTNQRTPGVNWSVSSGSDAVNKYIYNNRGVSYYDLYKLQPMYEIDLTPSLMRQIQQYNREQNNKKQWYYEGTGKSIYTTVGYSDFTLNCSASGGEKSAKCTSAIIRSWGVKGCAITGSGYTKCGNTTAW